MGPASPRKFMKTGSPDDVARALLPVAPRLIRALVGPHGATARERFSRLPRPGSVGTIAGRAPFRQREGFFEAGT